MKARVTARAFYSSSGIQNKRETGSGVIARARVVACDSGVGARQEVPVTAQIDAPEVALSHPALPDVHDVRAEERNHRDSDVADGSAADNDVPPGREDQTLKLENLVDSLCSLAALGWSDVSGEDATRVVRALERASRASAAIRSGALVAVSRNEQWVKDGNRNVNDWVERQTGRSKATATRAAKVAQELDAHLPQTQRALADGHISEDHANTIATRCTKTQKQRDRLKDPLRGEAYLLKRARDLDATQFAKFAHAWSTETDPGAADRAWQEEDRKQVVHLTEVEDGFLLNGRLNHDDGQVLQTALGAHMGRKAADDERPFPQRRAEALIGLARQSLDMGKQLPKARIRPHLTVTMDYLTLERLVQATGPSMPPATAFAHGLNGVDSQEREAVYRKWAQNWKPGDDHVISTQLDYRQLENVPAATLPDGTALAPGALARLACQSMLTRVVFGPESTILDAGREERIFPANQARAIIARDRHCQYPGCDEGPDFSEIHHSLEWYKHGGKTHADLGVLLCYTHHSHVHRRNITITRSRGRWIFTDAENRAIRAPDPNHVPGRNTELDRAAGNGIDSNALGPPSGAPPSGAPPVTIPASTPLCPDLWEQTELNLDPQPPF